MTRHGVEIGERGRIPFALVGVLLVVTSALFAAVVSPPARPAEPAVDLAVERTTADARATLRQAVSEAGVAAASNPVVTPAETEYGDLLDDGDPFEEALKIRIYLLARERFESIGRTHRGVRTDVSLPATPSAEALARAKDRVSVERAGPDGAQLDVTVEGVNQTARAGDRTVAERTASLSVRVDSPVLAVHDRVTTFQERLDADVTEPGLGQTVTARLYAVAWARGYAQYGGAPIENVVSNRHVGLITNGAVLNAQRSVFGESDPDGRASRARAVGAMALTEAMGQIDAGRFAEAQSLLHEGIREAAAPTERNGIQQPPVDAEETPSANDTMTVGVNETAWRAFTLITERDRMNYTIDSVYSANVTERWATNRVEGGEPDTPGEPESAGEWELVSDTTDSDVQSVENVSGGPAVTVPDGHHELVRHTRSVRIRHEHLRIWVDNGTGNRSTTVSTSTERQRVTISVTGNHAQTPFAPDNPIETVHERGGPFNGSNLADARRHVFDSVESAADPNGAARAAASGESPDTSMTVYGNWSEELPEWAYSELVALRQEVRNVSVEVQRGQAGAFATNPPERLAAELRDQRADLLDAPAEYDHTADKARIALRGMYLERVIQLVDEQAQAYDDAGSGLGSAISSHTDGSLEMLQRTLDARRVDGDRDDTGGLRMTVDGAPPYLTLSSIDHSQVSAVEEGETVHPLVARNVNVATVPYGDVADTVTNALTGDSSGRVNLRTAGEALESADAVDETIDNESFETDHATLQFQVYEAVSDVRDDVTQVLDRQGVGAGSQDREEIVADAFGRWETLPAMARAIGNQSVVDAVVTSAGDHPSTNLSAAMRRDALRVALHTDLQATLESSDRGVEGPAVEAVTDRTKSLVGNATERVVTDQLERRYNHSINRMPAGIPLLPPVTGWFATTNAWIVDVEGRYERFAVEAPRRTPTPADASLSYVRDGGNVTMDVDGDGSGELFGRADRIGFELQTAVVVVVPGGKTGVGDVDGTMFEDSEGWPHAGPEDYEPSSENDTTSAAGSVRLPDDDGIVQVSPGQSDTDL